MEELAIRQAWEKFIDRGIRSAHLRDAVLTSWERSKDHLVSVESECAPLISEAEAYRHRSDNLWLARCAAPVLERCGRFLEASSSMMILTDPKGVIIETKGDDRSIDAGREIHLECGGRWTESDIGTNAIGTALAAMSPVQIHAAEHYCEPVQQWTCAAAPIFHPIDQELLGVIDLSGHAETFSTHSLAFAVSAADQIQAGMTKSIRFDHWKIVQFYRSKRRQWARDEAILVDRRGAIVGATSNALNLAHQENIGISDDHQIAKLRSQPFSNWEECIERLLPSAKTELVCDDGMELGAVIILGRRGGRGRNKRANPTNTRDQDVDLDSFVEGLLARDLCSAPFCLSTPSENERKHSSRDVTGIAVNLRDGTTLADEEIQMVADDPRVGEIVEQVDRAASRKMPILINGETGTGKELLAFHAHANSGRDGAFVPVNCAAIPANLIEAELFGFVDGAFTGARPGGAKGLAEQADGGTLFLDEIGDMPVALQAVLLRLLDDWTVRPIGGSPKKVDVLLVSATNVDLTEAVKEGRLRRDLYYRLNTLEVTLPPLAQREDFAALATHLLHMIDKGVQITPEAIEILAERSWQGNMRELKSELARLSFNCTGGVITESDARRHSIASEKEGAFAATASSAGALQDLKRAHVLTMYSECKGNVAETARRLGVSRNTVYRFLNQQPKS